MKEIINNWIKEHPTTSINKIFNNTDIKNWVFEQTKNYKNIENLSERLYIALYGEPPKCVEGNKRKFNTFQKGYRIGCHLGHKCPDVTSFRLANQQKTFEKKYGSQVKNPNDLAFANNKRKQTNIQRRGVPYPAQSIDVKTRYLETINTFSEEKKQSILEKRTNTMMIKYQNEHHMKLQEFKDKVKNTNIKRYGVKTPLENKDILDKVKEKFKNKSEEEKQTSINNSKQTIFERYGVTAASRIGIDQEVLLILDNQELFIKTITNKTRQEVQDELKISPSALYLYSKKYNAQQYFNTSHPRSRGEQELFEYIQNLIPFAEYSNKTIIAPKELDIFIPELNIAFEYCGLYWHNETQPNRDKNYHYNKFIQCKEKGITLITIFEDEWLNQQDLVKHRIKHILNKSNKIFARNCKLTLVDQLIAQEFLYKYHLQGYVRSTINLGLMYKNELVAIMTFGKPRYNKKYQWELLRFCTKLHVTGAASKLFSHFINNYKPESIVSYSDNRWSPGNMYSILQFTKIKESIGYYYTNNKERFNRLKFQKNKLIKMGFDSNLPEWQIMLEQGYYRIWDCGQIQWSWTTNSYK